MLILEPCIEIFVFAVFEIKKIDGFHSKVFRDWIGDFDQFTQIKLQIVYYYIVSIEDFNKKFKKLLAAFSS